MSKIVKESCYFGLKICHSYLLQPAHYHVLAHTTRSATLAVWHFACYPVRLVAGRQDRRTPAVQPPPHYRCTAAARAGPHRRTAAGQVRVLRRPDRLSARCQEIGRQPARRLQTAVPVRLSRCPAVRRGRVAASASRCQGSGSAPRSALATHTVSPPE
jgi:hypothetical protein